MCVLSNSMENVEGGHAPAERGKREGYIQREEEGGRMRRKNQEVGYHEGTWMLVAIVQYRMKPDGHRWVPQDAESSSGNGSCTRSVVV